MPPLQRSIIDVVRERFESGELPPTLTEISVALGLSEGWKGRISEAASDLVANHYLSCALAPIQLRPSPDTVPSSPARMQRSSSSSAWC